MRKKRTGVTVCLFLCLACPCWHGCSQSFKAADQVVVEPKVVDFGRVNEVKGSLDLSFAIVNRGNQSVTIERARTSCDCTVTECNRTVLPPQGRMTVPFKVTVRGRPGKFISSIQVDVLGRAKPLFVTLKGTVYRDLWLDGKAIVCSTAGSATTVEKKFKVYTSDWPSVQFDTSALDPRMRLQEISRTKEPLGTAITFRLIMEMPAIQHTTTHHLVLKPINDKIQPLTIPVVCYRTASHDEQASLQPRQLNLGVIHRGEMRSFRLFGNAKLLDSLKFVDSDKVPEGITVELQPADVQGKSTHILAVHVGKSVPPGWIDGRLRFQSKVDGREHFISLQGLVRLSSKHRAS